MLPAFWAMPAPYYDILYKGETMAIQKIQHVDLRAHKMHLSRKALLNLQMCSKQGLSMFLNSLKELRFYADLVTQGWSHHLFLLGYLPIQCLKSCLIPSGNYEQHFQLSAMNVHLVFLPFLGNKRWAITLCHTSKEPTWSHLIPLLHRGGRMKWRNGHTQQKPIWQILRWQATLHRFTLWSWTKFVSYSTLNRHGKKDFSCQQKFQLSSTT